MTEPATDPWKTTYFTVAQLIEFGNAREWAPLPGFTEFSRACRMPFIQPREVAQAAALTFYRFYGALAASAPSYRAAVAKLEQPAAVMALKQACWKRRLKKEPV